VRGSRSPTESSILFSFETNFTGRVKVRLADRNFSRDGRGGAFTPAVILFICQRRKTTSTGVIPLDLLPRQCPVCQDHTIIGHGQRLHQTHDDRHEHIWVRRGVCRPCGKTFTILPDWPAPAALFTLRRGNREQSGENQAASLWFGNRIAKLLRSVDPETNGILRVA